MPRDCVDFMERSIGGRIWHEEDYPKPHRATRPKNDVFGTDEAWEVDAEAPSEEEG